MTERTCPNGCDLATFGTHAGPPDCDLGPADPEAVLATGIVNGPDGRRRTVEVAIPSGPIADALRAGELRGMLTDFGESQPRELSTGVLGLLPLVHIHPWCGRPLGEHAAWVAPESPCEFPERGPIEFATAPPEPAVRIVGLPDPGHLPAAVSGALNALAQACRDAYGLGVEVEPVGDREAAQLAVETIRRYLG